MRANGLASFQSDCYARSLWVVCCGSDNGATLIVIAQCNHAVGKDGIGCRSAAALGACHNDSGKFVTNEGEDKGVVNTVYHFSPIIQRRDLQDNALSSGSVGWRDVVAY